MGSGVTVLGVGNILLQDEGLGVRAVEHLSAHYGLPEDVRVVDGGALGLNLLPLIEDTNSLLIIDAIQASQEPGALVRLEGEDISGALALKMSMHQVGLRELLAVSSLRQTLPSRLVLWGMQPASIGWGLELSPPVAAGLGSLVEEVVGELRRWGAAVELRNTGGDRAFQSGGTPSDVLLWSRAELPAGHRRGHSRVS
jgi:hydrogenase maturation protease